MLIVVKFFVEKIIYNIYFLSTIFYNKHFHRLYNIMEIVSDNFY